MAHGRARVLGETGHISCQKLILWRAKIMQQHTLTMLTGESIGKSGLESHQSVSRSTRICTQNHQRNKLAHGQPNYGSWRYRLVIGNFTTNLSWPSHFLQNQGSPCIKCVKVAWKFAVFFSISWLMFVGACGCLRNKDQLVGRQLHCKTVDSGKPTFCLCFCDSKPVFNDSQIFWKVSYSHSAPTCLHLFQQQPRNINKFQFCLAICFSSC